MKIEFKRNCSLTITSNRNVCLYQRNLFFILLFLIPSFEWLNFFVLSVFLPLFNNDIGCPHAGLSVLGQHLICDAHVFGLSPCPPPPPQHLKVSPIPLKNHIYFFIIPLKALSVIPCAYERPAPGCRFLFNFCFKIMLLVISYEGPTRQYLKRQ